MSDQRIPKVRKAVFPVAGLGTRFLPATKAIPKEMLTVGDKPLIQHVVEEAREAGIEEFIFITGQNEELFEAHFTAQPELEKVLEARGKTTFLKAVRDCIIAEGKLFMTRQQEPLGLGHAVWCAKDLIGDEPFAVLLPDVLIRHKRGCLAQMMDVYDKQGGNIIALEEVPKEETQKYGVIATRNPDAAVIAVEGLVEKPKPEEAPSNLSVVGRYILQPELFDHLDKMERGAGGEIQLTDAMAKLIGQQPFAGMRFAGRSYDCGSKLGFIEANIAYGLSDPEIGGKVAQLLENYKQGQIHEAAAE